MLKKFHMMDTNPIDTNMGTNSKLDIDDSSSMVNETIYRGIIGSLLYLIASRPNILFSVVCVLGFKIVPKSLTLKLPSEY